MFSFPCLVYLLRLRLLKDLKFIAVNLNFHIAAYFSGKKFNLIFVWKINFSCMYIIALKSATDFTLTYL